MPSASPVNASSGGGGILRRKDGTILDIQFSDKMAHWKDNRETEEGKFHSLFANLTIQEDGRDKETVQSLFVGDADAYEIILDGRGLKGTKPLSKDAGFIMLLDTLLSPTDGGEGMPASEIPADDGISADFSYVRGRRVMFDWRPNAKKTKKLGQREYTTKDGRKNKADQEDLVIAAYYGKVDVSKVSAGKPAGKPAAAKASNAQAPTAVDAATVQAAAETQVAAILKSAKDNTLTRQKLSVKILNAMAGADAGLREAVRTFCLKGENLDTLDGVTFNPANDTVSYDAAA